MTLYQRIMGEDFDNLPPVLRRFHSSERGASAAGVFTVKREPGVLRAALSKLSRMPPAGENVQVRLQVIAGPCRETWIRQFDGHILTTVQWQRANRLVEKGGPLRFVLRLTGSKKGMRFETERCELWEIRVPRVFSLSATAEVEGYDDYWNVEVRIAAPLLGTIVTYRGRMTQSNQPSGADE